MNNVVFHRPDKLPLTRACQVLGLNRSTVYAHQRRAVTDERRRSRQQSVQPHALSAEASVTVVETLHNAPIAISRLQKCTNAYWSRISLCVRSAPCIVCFANCGKSQQRPAQRHAVPRLKACAPHEVWTWDITKLPLIRRGIYLSLYVVLDLFSRFAVAFFGGIDGLAQGEQHPINAPYQRTLSTHPINAPYQRTLSTHPINAPYQRN